MTKQLKKIVALLIAIFIISSNALYASDTLYFVGNINLSKKVSYKYIIRFTIGKDNKVVGYSLTDPKGNDEIKTRIVGTYDSATQTLDFQEQNILRTNIDKEKNDFCFVKASLKLKKDRFFEVLVGNFTATQPGKTEPCAKGDIKIINTDRIKAIMAKFGDKTEITPKQEEPSNPKTPITIADNNIKYLSITGNNIKFTIWDNGQVDGDRISIQLNGKYILENYTLDTKVKEIEEILSGNAVDTIRIIALNEGTLPPNTATIRIESKYEKYPIEIQASLNEVRTIVLRKKAL